MPVLYDERTVRFITNGWGSDANLRGIVETEPEESFSVEGGLKFYEFSLRVDRLSETQDHIFIMARKEQIEGLEVGDWVEVVGTIKSYDLPIAESDDERKSPFREFNVTDKEGNPITVVRNQWFLKIYISAKKITKTDERTFENLCHISGTIVSKEELRITADGKKVLRFKVLILNRNAKSYIYSVAWNEVATMISNMSIGDEVIFLGRMQSWDNPKSRQYPRRLEYSANYLLNRLRADIYGL